MSGNRYQIHRYSTEHEEPTAVKLASQTTTYVSVPEACRFVVGARYNLTALGRPRQCANWTRVLWQRYDVCCRENMPYVDVAVATAGCEVLGVRRKCEREDDGRRRGADATIDMAGSVPSHDNRSSAYVPENDFFGGRATRDTLVVVGEGKTGHYRLQTLSVMILPDPS